MGELSIKIKIGDREYPMKVDSAEEERVRIAGRLINEKMKNYKDRFGIDDKQDLLAMTAFDFLTEKMRTEAKSSEVNQIISSKLTGLDNLVENTLID